MAEAGVGEAASQGAGDIGRGLGSKMGPLPVWGWVLVLGGGGLIVYFLFIKPKGGTGYSPFGFPTGGEGGGGGGGGATIPVTAPTLTNAGWLSNAIAGTVTGLGLSETEVAYYLNEALAGNRPTGNTHAYTEFQKVWDYATQNFGLPPISPTAGAPGASYYTTMQQWLSDVLAFGSASGSVAQELQTALTNTLNNVQTALSPDAWNAYNLAVSMIGTGPQGGLNVIKAAAPVTPATPPTVPTVTASEVTDWINKYLNVPNFVNNFGTWLSEAPSAVQTGFNATQQNQIYQYFINSSINGVRFTTDQLVTMINGWLANPASIPQPPTVRKVAPPQPGAAR